MNLKQKALNNKMRFETKEHAHEYYQAKKMKKKLPTFISKQKPRDPSFAKLSIEEYEKKYL